MSTAARRTPRIRAIVERLVLITAIIGATALLLSSLAVPMLSLTSDGVDLFTRDVLDVGPLPELPEPPANSYIYAADGTLLDEINFQENREPVDFADIPDTVVNAVIATEDNSFWEHNGVNSDAIMRSAVRNVAAGGIVGGGSTITQQYIKNAYQYISDDASAQTIERKIREASWAVQLEREISKEEILERYLNTAFFGSGAWGIGTAAERYFSKQIQELSLGEAATLAGVIRAPSGNNPIDNPDNAITRRDIVLGQMAEEGFISEEQRDRAIAEDLVLNPSQNSDPRSPFWTSWITQLLTAQPDEAAMGPEQVALLEMLGDSPDTRTRRVFQGGLRIHTTLDPAMQSLAEATIDDYLSFEGESRLEIANEPLGGIVTVEPGNGAIRTMALGPYDWGSCQGVAGDPSDDDWAGETESGELLCDLTQVNPLIPGGGGSEGRQPGSSFKPFVVATALEAGYPPGYTIDSNDLSQGGQPIEECPDSQDATGFYTPDNASPGGLQDMYSGIEKSVNVFNATLAGRVGTTNVADMASRLGLHRWYEAQQARDGGGPPGCSVALGGYAATPLEMATGYATLAASGMYCTPFAIDRIEDRDGNILWEHANECEQVIDEAVATRVIDIMAGPVGAGGTAPVVGERMAHPVRGKTGTTNNSIDAWFMGFTTRYATAAWVGYPNGDRTYDSVASAVAACPDQHDGDANDASDRTCRLTSSRTMQDVTIGGQAYSSVAGGTIPAPMWADYMNQVMADFEPEGFPEPQPIPQVTVPELVGLTSIAAMQEAAEAAGLQLGQETIVDWPPEGTVVGQNPPAGSLIDEGSYIFVQQSDGTGPVPVAPQVTGLPEVEALELLVDYEVSSFDREVADVELDGIVLRQSPEAGVEAIPGSGIAIEVGRFVEPAPTPTATPKPKPKPKPKPTTTPPPDDDGGGGGGG